MGMFAAGCVFTARPMVLILRVYLSALFRRRGGVEERRRAFQADGLWARSKAALPRHIVHAFVSLALNWPASAFCSGAIFGMTSKVATRRNADVIT